MSAVWPWQSQAEAPRIPAWVRFPLLFLVGGLSSLAFAPAFLSLTFPLGLAFGLVLISRAQTRRGAAGLAWVWALGHFLVGFHWLSWSATTDPAFYWLAPIILFAMPSVLSLFLAPALWCAWRFRAAPWLSLALVPAVWLSLEAARAFAFTGLPWNMAGQIWAARPELSQAAAWGGPWLLSLAAIGWGLASWVLLDPRFISSQGRRIFLGLSLFALVPIALFVGGAARITLLENQLEPTLATGARLGLVQANVPTTPSLSYDQAREDLTAHLGVSQDLIEREPNLDALIWPESGYDFLLNLDVAGRESVSGLLDVPLWITGGPWREEEQVWNTLYLVQNDGEILDHYFKSHLVPFGEYVPWWLPVGQLIGHLPSFSSGEGVRSLETPGLGWIGALICYEDVFPHRVVDPDQRPDWLLTITEDGWFGRWAGPQQHAVQAQMRAVEEGLPLVRVSNPGRSGLYDAFGRPQNFTELDVAESLVVTLPERLPPTLTARLGHGAMWLMLLLAWLPVLFLFLSHRGPYARR